MNHNELNLPKKILTDEGTIEIVYSQPAALYHAQGRAVLAPDGSLLRQEYSLRDHLGNTRVVFSDLDANGALDFTPNSPEIVQTNTYYPFGMLIEGMQPIDQADPVQAYRYNGKELTLMGGLYDYGFRYYDPMIGRFIGVDPIAEKFPHVNVYNYAENEPIANIDLWGLQAVRAENYVTSWTANKMAANNGKGYAQNFQDLKQNESGGDGAMQFLQGVREGFNNTGRWIESQMPAQGTQDPSAYEDENYTHQGTGIEMVTGLKLNANGVLALPSAENGAFTIFDDMEVGALTPANAGGALGDAVDASTAFSKALYSIGLAIGKTNDAADMAKENRPKPNQDSVILIRWTLLPEDQRTKNRQYKVDTLKVPATE